MKKASVADRILERLEGFANVLERGEQIDQAFTCRKITLDLETLSYSPEAVQKIREGLACSQALFARLLGVSVRTVQAWEQGATTPSPMACRWLAEIQRDPGYWLERVRQAVVEKQPRRRGRTASGRQSG